jgi:DNA-directed RNA polymerase specialized sigma24 family protein
VRWHQSDRDAIRNAEAWLVTTATRLAIDRLRALKAERDTYIGPWLPEPLLPPMRGGRRAESGARPDPVHHSSLAGVRYGVR